MFNERELTKHYLTIFILAWLREEVESIVSPLPLIGHSSIATTSRETLHTGETERTLTRTTTNDLTY